MYTYMYIYIYIIYRYQKPGGSKGLSTLSGKEGLN